MTRMTTISKEIGCDDCKELGCTDSEPNPLCDRSTMPTDHVDVDEPPAVLLGRLKRGIRCITPLEREHLDAGNVHLVPGDETCSECDELIDAEEFPGAPLVMLLANMKLAHGETYCEAHLGEVSA